MAPLALLGCTKVVLYALTLFVFVLRFEGERPTGQGIIDIG